MSRGDIKRWGVGAPVGRKVTVLSRATDPADMQRRAAGAYVALFVVIAVGAAYGSFSGRFPELSHNFWAIAVLSGVAAVLLLAMAYMPVRRD